MTVLNPTQKIGATKFTFDTVFEENGIVHEGPTSTAHRSGADTHIEMMKAAAYEQGMADARAELENKTEDDQENLLKKLLTAATNLVSTADQNALASQQAATDIAHKIALTLAPALIKREPATEIKAVIAECLQHLHREPHLAIRVNETALEETRPFVEQMARECGIEERVLLIADPSLGISDCKVEWSEGGVSRALNEIQEEIDLIINRYLDALSPSGAA